MSIRYITILLTVTALATGCATNGRRVLLKEYGTTVPSAAAQDLKGITVCLASFTCASNLVSLDAKSKPDQVEHYKYVTFTRDQDKAWDTEMVALAKRTTKADWKEIGNVRNGWGMVMSHVYAINDPAAWLSDSLRLDFESEGAKVIDSSQPDSADVAISGTIQLCRVDMYMKIWGDLVVDLDLKSKQGSARHRRIHTSGGTLASLASEGEYYHALRECRQKLSVLLSGEILRAIQK